MARSKKFSVQIPQAADRELASVIRQLVDELNRLRETVDSQSAGASRLVSDKQPFRVQTVDKGVFRLEVDTPEGVKKIDLADLE